MTTSSSAPCNRRNRASAASPRAIGPVLVLLRAKAPKAQFFLDEAANGWRALRSTDHGQCASARAPQGAQFAIGCPATGDNCYDRNCSVRICGTEIRRTKERSELLAEFNEWLRVNKMPPEPNDAEVPAKPWNILQYLGLL